MMLAGLKLRIVCDICKVTTFSSFDEAQAHQEICLRTHSANNENGVDTSNDISNTIVDSSNENNSCVQESIEINSQLCHPCVQPDDNSNDFSTFVMSNLSNSIPAQSDSIENVNNAANNGTGDSIAPTTLVINSLPPPPPRLPPNNNEHNGENDDGDIENTWPQDKVTIPLSMTEDEANLTPKHCFVRQHCLHIFPATHEFVGRKNPKGKPIVLGQIGMGCPYCLRHVARKEIREAVLFPNEISQMYNAALCLLQRHFPCSLMPDNLRETFLVLNRDKRRRNISKQ